MERVRSLRGYECLRGTDDKGEGGAGVGKTEEGGSGLLGGRETDSATLAEARDAPLRLILQPLQRCPQRRPATLPAPQTCALRQLPAVCACCLQLPATNQSGGV